MSQRTDIIFPASPVNWAHPERKVEFDAWLQVVVPSYGLDPNGVRMASADASFRRYLRIDGNAGSYIIMDAPPDKGSCTSFVNIAKLMAGIGLKVPEVLQWDEPRGFMLLTNMGQQTLLQSIDADAPPPLDLYLDAVDTLVQWQLASREGVLPPYSEPLLRRDLELFPQWYITEHHQTPVDTAMRKTLDEAFACILANNQSFPYVYVHRDFMPRNLMVGAGGVAAVAQERLGVLDFQDAVYGPITYDIASLMRDAFLSWEEDFCLDVTIRYWERARKAGLPVGDDFGEFYRGVEWMGLQRHLKVAGIFARLSLRDGKPHYLADTPRFIDYIRSTCSRYRELKPLLRLVEKVEGIAVPNVFAFGRT
jgi:aminoglycoside/choline kinase family phosphotransferase